MPATRYSVSINGQPLDIHSVAGGLQNGPEVTPLRLVAYMRPGASPLTAIAHEVANLGQNKRVTIVVKLLAGNGSVTKTTTYDNCLFTSLDFPKAEASSNDRLMETATFKPQTIVVS